MQDILDPSGGSSPGAPSAGGSEDAGTVVRLLREIIRTPTFVEVIKANLGNLDQASARELVRTLMNEDPELSVDVAVTLPQVVNYLTAAAAELGRQLDRLPEGLGDQYLDELTRGLDFETIEEIAETYRSLLERIDFKGTLIRVFGRTVNLLADTINSSASRNPYFLRDVLKEVDGVQVLRAFLAVAGSAFLCVLSRLFRLFSRS